MQEKIGFDWQDSYGGECGKFAIIHSLLCLGIPVSLKELRKKIMPKWLNDWKGLDEKDIIKALKYYDCESLEIKTSNPSFAKNNIDTFLEKGYPVIVCTDEYNHWAIIAGKTKSGKYIWIDSIDNDLIGAWSWGDIDEWIYCSEDEEYYFIGVEPQNENVLKHTLIPNFEKVWEYLTNLELCQWWGYYLDDLNDLFDSPVEKDSISAEEFFETYGPIILKLLENNYIDSDNKYNKWELENYKKVALAYKLSISKNEIAKAIASISINLTLYATGNY